jgi:hypothetical protein
MAKRFSWEPEAKPPGTFVPPGVDATSWSGFEQKVRARRLRALMGAVDGAITRGDRAAAETSLDEARQLAPDSQPVQDAAARLAAMAPPRRPPHDGGLGWSRMFGAVGLLLVGVSLLLGIDWLRTPPPLPLAPPTVIAAPAFAPPVVPVDPEAVATVGAAGGVATRALATVLRDQPASAAAPPRKRPAASAPAAVASDRPTGWGKVLKPTARFLKSTLPKILTSPI